MKLKRSIDSMAHSRSHKGGRMRLNYQFLSFSRCCIFHLVLYLEFVCLYLWIYVFLCFCICLFVLIDSWDFVQTSQLLVFVVECNLIVNSFHSAESFKLGYYPPRQSEDLALSTFECSRADGSFRDCILYFCICLHFECCQAHVNQSFCRSWASWWSNILMILFIT